MKTFRVNFKNGENVTLKGKNIVDALMKNYYDNSIVSMIESYQQIKGVK